MNISIDDWQGVDEDSLDSEKKAIFLKRKKAVMMLVNGVKFTAIQNITGITRNNLLRLIDRCEEVDRFGLKYGFKALIPYKRIGKYNKKSTKGYQGAFTKLLRDYPELKSHIENLFLGKRIEGIKFRDLSITNVHKSFISYCRQLNISENDYPFSTKTEGRESLRQYCKNLSKTNLILDTHNRRSIDNANDLRAFQKKIDKKIIKTSNRPYSLVQIDGHSADAAFLLNTYNPYNEEKVVVYRFWLILAIDVASRKVLGYSFSLNKNYRLLDLIYCLINSLTGQQLYTTSTVMSDESSTSSIAFDMITLDNHMSHRSPQLIDKLCKITGATVRLNPGRRPRANAVVERVFKTLKPSSTDLVPSSLGSYPSSPKRFKPDKFAKQNEVDYGFITNLIEETIKAYNNKFHSSIGSSPNEYIERYLKRNTFPFRKVKTDTLFGLLTKKAKVNVRGKTSSQVRPPHINFQRAKYYATNVDLAACYYGESVTVVYNLLDLRVFKVYLSNGEELCDFVVEDKWNKRHSLYERKLINNLLNKEEIMHDPNDYVGSVIEHVKKGGAQKKDMLRKLKQGDVDRQQRVSSTKSHNEESNTSFAYPKFNIFDNQ